MMRMIEIAVVLGMMISVGVCQDRSPTLHKVGGSKGWTQNFNYTDWAFHDHFFQSDWLLFRFDKRYYNVLEVNETSYMYCNDQSFITNITRGGRDVFQLTEARTYYFLSSGGYCFHGMKLAINVTPYDVVPSPPPPPPNPNPNHSSSSSSAQPLLLSSLLMILLLFGGVCH